MPFARRAATTLVLLGLLLGLPGGGGSAGATEPSLSWRLDEGPEFRLTFTAGGRELLAQSPGGAPGPTRRLSYRLADASFHSLTTLLSARRTRSGAVYRVATDEPGRTATVTLRRIPGGARLSLRLRPERGVREVYEAFAGSTEEHFLGTGQRPGHVDLRGTVQALKVLNGCRRTIAVPFFLSSRGYGIRLVTTAVGMVSFPGASYDAGFACDADTPPCAQEGRPSSTRVCVKAARLDYEVYGGTPAEVVAAHAASAGRPALPPPAQFALVKWRDVVRGPEELFDDIERLRRLRIPQGWILLDNPWEAGAWGTGCYGSLTFDRERFPDPKAMIDRIHALGVRFMLWVSPQVRAEGGCPPPPYAEGDVLGDGETWVVDLTRPRARSLFERRIRALVALGVDGFKGDRADEVDLEGRALHGGPGTSQHNRIPVLYARVLTDALRRRHGSDFATMSRAGYAGSQRLLPGVIGLDLPHDFRGLSEAIRLVQNAGVSGFPTWGVDVGGYSGDSEVTSEVFVRWAQFASVTPIFEVGGEGVTARFWELGSRTVALFREAAVFHYELFPHLYGLAREAARTGLPIVRPLGLHYPRDERAWRADGQFLVGPDLLAAPVRAGGRRGTDLSGPPSRLPVYLPAGPWVDVHTGRALRGPRSLVRPTPIDELPLYLRGGAALRLNLREPLVWARPWGLNDLERAGRAGWVYAPGPGRTRADGGPGGTLTASRSEEAVRLALERAPRETQVLVLGLRRPCRVEIAGRAVPPAGSLAALRRSPSGWAVHRGRFPGIVVKLTRPSRVATLRHAC